MLNDLTIWFSDVIGCIEMEHWPKMGQVQVQFTGYKQKQTITLQIFQKLSSTNFTW